MKRAPLVLACFLTLPSGVYGPPTCQARLELVRQAPFLTVTGHCRSLLDAPAHYRYQLLVVRQSPAGRSQSAQGGEFGLAPQQEVRLSEVRVSVLGRDRYSALLLIFDQTGQVVARDSAVQGSSPH